MDKCHLPQWINPDTLKCEHPDHEFDPRPMTDRYERNPDGSVTLVTETGGRHTYDPDDVMFPDAMPLSAIGCPSCRGMVRRHREQQQKASRDPSPLVVVFPDFDWLYAGGYRGGYDLPTGDDRAARLQVLRGERAEVTGRGGSDYPLTVLPSRVRTA